jgi:hypothetical protein
MRLRASAVVLVSLLATAPPAAADVWLDPSVDPVVARSAQPVVRMLALRDRVFFATGDREGRPQAFGRIVQGRQRPVRGIPVDAWPQSIGLDRGGRVVVVTGVAGSRILTYDVTRDRVRRLRVDFGARHPYGPVAVWRHRVAWAFEEGVVLRERARTRVLPLELSNARTLVLRGRSLSAITDYGDDDHVWALVDRGRRCPDRMLAYDNQWYGLDPVSLGGGTLRLGLSDQDFGSGPVSAFRLLDFELPGRCRPAVRRGVLAAARPGLAIGPAAVAGRALYYVVGGTIHRRDLAARGSASPPPNDDFADAERLTGDPPIEVTGLADDATLERGEPRPPGVGATVWYRWVPPDSGEVLIRKGYYEPEVAVYAGDRLGSLELVPYERVPDPGEWFDIRRYRLQGGVEYRIAVGRHEDAWASTYRPLDLRILPSAVPPTSS